MRCRSAGASSSIVPTRDAKVPASDANMCVTAVAALVFSSKLRIDEKQTPFGPQRDRYRCKPKDRDRSSCGAGSSPRWLERPDDLLAAV